MSENRQLPFESRSMANKIDVNWLLFSLSVLELKAAAAAAAAMAVSSARSLLTLVENSRRSNSIEG